MSRAYGWNASLLIAEETEYGVIFLNPNVPFQAPAVLSVPTIFKVQRNRRSER